MDEYTIMKCRLCGKLMKRAPMQVYRGDSTCCDEGNDTVSDGDWQMGGDTIGKKDETPLIKT